MLKPERKAIILDALQTNEIVSLDTLMQLLSSSESTVRRDLDELEADGKLRRVHGGAERIQPLQEELSNEQKSVKNIQVKQRIASKALSLIDAHDVIFIDAGTTTQCLIELIQPSSNIVITNSIHHAAKLVEKGIRTTIIGGFVKRNTDATIGQVAIDQIKLFNVDKAFIGMNAMDHQYLTTPDPEEAAVKRTIIEQSKKSYVLVDGSKLGQQSLVNVSPIQAATIITTDDQPALLQKIKKETEVIIA